MGVVPAVPDGMVGATGGPAGTTLTPLVPAFPPAKAQGQDQKYCKLLLCLTLDSRLCGERMAACNAWTFQSVRSGEPLLTFTELFPGLRRGTEGIVNVTAPRHIFGGQT
ncbi:hypothetical protein ASE75_00595 [Sphingomonas sp. Leaf17]|nr:hypothetical protein ASE75_00595 [Sphingomonas sp. Leaf17]